VASGVSGAVQWYLHGKCAQKLNKFYQKTKQKVAVYADKIDWRKTSPGFIDIFPKGKQKLPPHAYLDPEGNPLAPHIIEAIENGKDHFKKQIDYHHDEIVENVQDMLKKQGVEYPHPIIFEDIDFKHLIVGDWNPRSKKATGLHSIRWVPERKVDVLIPPNELGIWEGIFKINGKEKRSTFFPKTWNEYIISDKIIEALLNIEKVLCVPGGIKILGKTSEYIEIGLFVGNVGIIETVFPKL
jgi:hypothetical protein